MDVLSARVTQLIRHLREDRLAGAERRKKGNIEIRAKGGIFLKRRAFRYGRRRSEQERSKTRSLFEAMHIAQSSMLGELSKRNLVVSKSNKGAFPTQCIVFSHAIFLRRCL